MIKWNIIFAMVFFSRIVCAGIYRDIYQGESYLPNSEMVEKCTLELLRDSNNVVYDVSLDGYGIKWDRKTQSETVAKMSFCFSENDERFNIETNVYVQSSWAYPGYERFGYRNETIPAKISNIKSYIVRNGNFETVFAVENQYLLFTIPTKKKILECRNLIKAY